MAGDESQALSSNPEVLKEQAESSVGSASNDSSKSTTNTAVLKRSDLYKSSQTKQLDAPDSGTSGTAHTPQTCVSTSYAVPSHWPEEDMTTSFKVQVIEAARQLAFPGRRGRQAFAA